MRASFGRLSTESRSRLVLLAVQALALLVFVISAGVADGFPIDDAWIHQLVARTWVESGTLGAVPGKVASGASSLLWPAILALNHALLGLGEPSFSAGIGAALYLFSGQALLTLLLRDRIPATSATAAAALGALSGNYLWFAFSGMETGLLVALSVAVVLAWTRPNRSSTSAWVAGGFLATAFLTRPEAGALAGLVVATTALFGRPWLHAARAALPAVVAMLAYVVATPAGPTTLNGRRWMWLADGQGAGPEVLALRLFERWADRLARFVVGAESPILFWIVVGFALLGAAWAVVQRAHRLLLLVSWALVHFATYAVLMPAEGHGGRYQPLTCWLFPVLTMLGLSAILAGLAATAPAFRRTEQHLVVAAACALGIPALATVDEWAKAHALAVRHVNDTEVKMGLLLRRMPPAAKLASFDVGGIAYFSRRPLLDLGALFEPALLETIAMGRTDELLAREMIDYVVVPMGYDDFPDVWNFKHRLGLEAPKHVVLKPVLEFGSHPEVWVPGLEATLHCSPRQVLFEVQR